MFKKEFNEYMDACYKQEIHHSQQKEVRQAFYAGGFASFNALNEIRSGKGWPTYSLNDHAEQALKSIGEIE